MGATIAVDFDHTIKNDGDAVLPGAITALQTLRDAGFSILIHSCNDPEWIRLFLNNHTVPYDDIWEGHGKPICFAYVDDRGVGFDGDWDKVLTDIAGIEDRRTHIKGLNHADTNPETGKV